jgi:mannose-1-phosphate guanylyltransferase
MKLGEIQVAILAGGLGTRLRCVLPDLPKVLAPVNGKPFLEYLLEWLIRSGSRRVVLCLGYRSDEVLSYLSSRSFAPLEILTIVEPEPLGTGGAVSHARGVLVSDPVIIMNGDTVLDVDLNEFLAAHRASQAEISIVTARVDDSGRYGRVELDANDRVAQFEEKNPNFRERAWINAGIYCCSASILDRIALLPTGSLERDVFEKLPSGTIRAFRTHGSFLDIGSPESLGRAPEVLPA